jgi:predicted RNase H-like nuclease
MKVAGVDGCKKGWIVVSRDLGGAVVPTIAVVPHFGEIIADKTLAVIAVDMPIGLPDRSGPKGRGPERHVRPLLGQRQSSVFSVPSRAAVFSDEYRDACETALATSDPPKKVSKQAFYLFPKIREIDALITPALEDRVYEVHPELAFWRLNGEEAMSLPKKVKSRANPAGLEQRKRLLEASGFDRAFLDQRPPKGAGVDDLIDACVGAVIAQRIANGDATPFPPAFERDAKGLRMAIWA